MKHRPPPLCMPRSRWIMTFTDLVTLIMVFFVMLLSMSSMDVHTLSRIKNTGSGFSSLSLATGAPEEERIAQAATLLGNPRHLLQAKDELFQLMFPGDRLPPQLHLAQLKRAVQFEIQGDGVAIILTDALFFDAGSTKLGSEGKTLLAIISPVLKRVSADILVTGYAGDEGRADAATKVPHQEIMHSDMAALRGLAVIEHFVSEGLDPRQFSLSAYGTDRRAGPKDRPETHSHNRRVEILLKTEPRHKGTNQSN